MPRSTRDLRGFTGAGYEIGRGKLVQALWMLVSGAVFVRWWCPARLRVAILRAFGAQVADDVLIRHRVRIHWPWKLTIGQGSWVGEGAWLLNLEQITIGSDVCISQEVLVCTGSHNRRSPTFEFDNAPIWIEDEAWVATRAIILRGVTIGRRATVPAGVTVGRDVLPDSVVRTRSRQEEQ